MVANRKKYQPFVKMFWQTIKNFQISANISAMATYHSFLTNVNLKVK